MGPWTDPVGRSDALVSFRGHIFSSDSLHAVFWDINIRSPVPVLSRSQWVSLCWGDPTNPNCVTASELWLYYLCDSCFGLQKCPQPPGCVLLWNWVLVTKTVALASPLSHVASCAMQHDSVMQHSIPRTVTMHPNNLSRHSLDSVARSWPPTSATRNKDQ